MPKLFATLALALSLSAGGFYLEIGNPTASHDPKARNAVVLAQFVGCGPNPEAGTLTITAERTLNGKLESLPVRATALDKPGLYAITRQWPAEGDWQLRMVGKHPELSVTTTTILTVRGDSFSRADMVMKMDPVR